MVEQYLNQEILALLVQLGSEDPKATLDHQDHLVHKVSQASKGSGAAAHLDSQAFLGRKDSREEQEIQAQKDHPEIQAARVLKDCRAGLV